MIEELQPEEPADQEQAEVTVHQVMSGEPPPGFWRLAQATDRLQKGMWGSFRSPVAVRDLATRIKQSPQESPLRQLEGIRSVFIPRRADAAQRLWAAALKGDIPIYVTVEGTHKFASGNDVASQPENPVRLPVEVLKKLIIPPNTLPDHAIRPTLKTAGGDSQLLALLTRGQLVIRMSEFDSWYEAQRAKGKWPSRTAQEAKKKRRGRPSKQSEELKTTVLALVQDQKWDGTRKLTELHALLKECGHVAVPSLDTLRRLVKRLLAEEGDVRLYRRCRVRRAPGRPQLTAK